MLDLYKNFFKRFFDIILSLLILILISPIFVLIFILIFVDLGFPLFFQKRFGLENKIFTIIKFKTMKDDINLTESERLTRLTKLIRKYGLDEIPQLLNILKNDMSLIGPRPLPIYILNKKKYEKVINVRHSVKPGLTGLSQINGNSKLSLEKKLFYDLNYVKNLNFKIDFVILLKTIKIVLWGKKS